MLSFVSLCSQDYRCLHGCFDHVSTIATTFRKVTTYFLVTKFNVCINVTNVRTFSLVQNVVTGSGVHAAS
jgi:hypothetical protein